MITRLLTIAIAAIALALPATASAVELGTQPASTGGSYRTICWDLPSFSIYGWTCAADQLRTLSTGVKQNRVGTFSYATNIFVPASTWSTSVPGGGGPALPAPWLDRGLHRASDVSGTYRTYLNYIGRTRSGYGWYFNMAYQVRGRTSVYGIYHLSSDTFIPGWSLYGK